MRMKRVIVLVVVFAMLLVGCANKQEADSESAISTDNQTFATANTGADESTQMETAHIITPLPDTTIENLTDAILSVSLEVGDAYFDDNGTMWMDVTVYTYDQYDMVDIANLNVGDTILRHSGEVEVTSVERNEFGTLYINGGLENGGFDLTTDDSGVFYEIGYNDSRNWYAAGEVTLPLADNFVGVDDADLEFSDLALTPENFLNDNIYIFGFTPYNTTIRVENGQIVELDRRYTP